MLSLWVLLLALLSLLFSTGCWCFVSPRRITTSGPYDILSGVDSSSPWERFDESEGVQQSSLLKDGSIWNGHVVGGNISEDVPTLRPANFSSADDGLIERMPSLNDLHERFEAVQKSLERKAELFKKCISRIQKEAEETRHSMVKLHDYYNNKIHTLEQKSSLFEHNIKAKEAQCNKQLNNLRKDSLRKDKEATEKIYWLAEQLQELKFRVHKQQLEAAKAAQEKQAETQTKLDNLKLELERQIAATQSESNKAEEFWKRRMEIEQELSSLQKEFAATVRNLEGRLQDEHHARIREMRALAKQKELEALVDSKEAEYQELVAKADELLNARIEVEKELSSLKHLHDSTVAELEVRYNSTQKAREEEQLAAADALAEKEAEAQRRIDKLTREKEAALAKQSELQALVDSKEVEYKEQVVKADELLNTRKEVEEELSSLKHRYDSTVADWEARYNSTQKAREEEQLAAADALAQKEAEAQRRIDAATAKAERYEAALREDIKSKEDEHAHNLLQLEESSERKEKEMSKEIQKISKELTLQKERMQQERVAADAAAAEKQKQLELAVKEGLRKAESIRFDMSKQLMEKDVELLRKTAEIGELTREKEAALSKQQTERTEWMDTTLKELWQRRMELEHEVSVLKKQHAAAVDEWKARYQSLQNVYLKEQQATDRLLARKEAEAQAKISFAEEQSEKSEAALKSGLMAKDAEYNRTIQRLKKSFAEKEKELTKKIHSIADDFQQFRFDSHRKLMQERVEKQDEILAQIDLNDAELQDQQTARAVSIEKGPSWLKKKNNSDVAEFDKRHRSLQDARVREGRDGTALFGPKDVEVQKKIPAAVTKRKRKRKPVQDVLRRLKAIFKLNSMWASSNSSKNSVRDK